MSMLSMFQTFSAQHTVAITTSSLRKSDREVSKPRISCNILIIWIALVVKWIMLTKQIDFCGCFDTSFGFDLISPLESILTAVDPSRLQLLCSAKDQTKKHLRSTFQALAKPFLFWELSRKHRLTQTERTSTPMVTSTKPCIHTPEQTKKNETAHHLIVSTTYTQSVWGSFHFGVDSWESEGWMWKESGLIEKGYK